jgi:hypothetical protein
MAASLARHRRLLGAILIVYGLVGVLIGLTATWAAVTTATRIEPAAERIDATRDSVVASLDAASVALDRAATAATTAQAGLEAAASATGRAAGLLRELATGASGLAEATGSVSILGQTPFAGLAQPLTQLAAAAGDLAQDVEPLGTSLSSLAGQSPVVADGLAVLGERLDDVARQLEGLGLDDALVSSTRILAAAAALLFAWLAMIAVAALAAGVWLLRWKESPARKSPAGAGASTAPPGS